MVGNIIKSIVTKIKVIRTNYQIKKAMIKDEIISLINTKMSDEAVEQYNISYNLIFDYPYYVRFSERKIKIIKLGKYRNLLQMKINNYRTLINNQSIESEALIAKMLTFYYYFSLYSY